MTKTVTTDLTASTQVVLENHSRLWKWKFRKERLFLRALLGRNAGVIEHFGSTSISGMIAKPIIDIQVALPNFEQGFNLIGAIERLGYTYHGENADRREYFFHKGSPVQFNLYLLEPTNDVWVRRSAFRDWLSNNRGGADWLGYGALKIDLASEHPEDLRAYQDAKLSFVDEVTDRAIRTQATKPAKK